MAEDLEYEPGARGEMDYREHRRTYQGFLWLVKYGTIAVIAILIAMLVGLIAGGGVISSVFAMVVFFVAASFMLREGDEKSMKH